MEAFLVLLIMALLAVTCIEADPPKHRICARSAKAYISTTHRTCFAECIHEQSCHYDACACKRVKCENGGSCYTVDDTPRCCCTSGFKGNTCSIKISDCRPGPVDVVFVLDVSISLSNGLDKSLDYVKKFINRAPVGPNYFQFAVITYSTDATVIFDFNDYTDKAEIESALKDIRFQAGATFTQKALSQARQILSDHSSGARMTVASKYIILLTDGLSTDRRDAIKFAKTLNSNGYRMMTIGIGNQVDHTEILQLASNFSYVYSPERDDALYQMMLENSDKDCKNCSESSMTDIFILLDTSSAHQTESQYHGAVNVVKTLVRQLKVKDTDVHVGMATFDDSVDPVFNLGDTSDTDTMLSHVVTARRSKGAIESNATNALWFTQHKAFKPESGRRLESRQIVVLFSNGHWKDINSTKREIQRLAQNSIKVFVVGTGRDANIENLFEVVTSAFNVIYIENSSDKDNVKSIVSETRFVNCSDELFG